LGTLGEDLSVFHIVDSDI